MTARPPAVLLALASAAVLAGAAGAQPRPPVSGDIVFLQETRRAATAKQALLTGTLVVHEGCLYAAGPNGRRTLLVWPAEAALDTTTERGRIRVWNRGTGTVVRVGEQVAFGGGSFPDGGPRGLNRPIPARCTGQPWDVDSFEPLADFHGRYPHMARPTPMAPPPPPRPGVSPPSRDHAAEYAKRYGITRAEALRRLSVQSRDEIGRVNELVQTREADTFAGLWIQHEPEYRVVVAFTRSPAATLRKYTTDPMFEARLARVTERELRATQERLFRAAGPLGAHPMMSSVDIKRGRVILQVEDARSLREAARRGRLVVPPYVDIVEPKPLMTTPPPARR